MVTLKKGSQSWPVLGLVFKTSERHSVSLVGSTPTGFRQDSAMTRRDVLLSAMMTPDLSWRAELAKWRLDRVRELNTDQGWLSVAGLFWLDEDRPRTDVAEGVEFLLRGGKVTVHGREQRELLPDVDKIIDGSRTLFVIERGGRFAIRVRDRESLYRRQFTHLDWYEPREDLRVEGKWTPYPEVRVRRFATVIEGVEEDLRSPGFADFTLLGRPSRLEPVLSGQRLMFVFKDLTSRSTTYPAGRFLYTEMPRDGKLELDFNRAVNPPCAYTPFATCPLPTRENQLDFPVEAGEKRYQGPH